MIKGYQQFIYIICIWKRNCRKSNAPLTPEPCIPAPFSSDNLLLKLNATLAASVFGRGLDNLSFSLHLLLLLYNPRLAALLNLGVVRLESLSGVQNVNVVHAADHAGDVRVAAFVVVVAHSQDEVQLDVLGAGVVLEKTGAEAGFDSSLGDHVALGIVLWVKLAHSAATSAQRRIQAVEEAIESSRGRRLARLCAAEPLDGGDADGGVEGARAERHSLANVGEHQVALDVALQRNVQHGGRDVHADPGVRPAVGGVDGGEDLAGEAAAAADVEDEGGGLEVEKLEGAAGHGGLDVLDTGAGGVFAGFGVIVVDVGRAGDEAVSR